jgi:hypothetical protein
MGVRLGSCQVRSAVPVEILDRGIGGWGTDLLLGNQRTKAAGIGGIVSIAAFQKVRQ